MAPSDLILSVGVYFGGQGKLRAAGVHGELIYITQQIGMFSFSGLALAQMQSLRSEFGVCGVDSGRICVAAINSRNIDAVGRHAPR